MRRRSADVLTLVACVVVLGMALALPTANITTIDILIVFASYAALGTSWNWSAGLGGLLNLAHVAYYAIGAYACALAVAVFGIHPAFGMIAGMAVAGVLAALICSLSLRLKVADLYFALLTITLMEGLAAIFRGIENEYALGGIYLPFRNDPASLQFLDKTIYFYILACLAVALVLVQFFVQRSKFGLLIVSSRDNAATAASVGVPVNRVLTGVAFASAVPASLVGSIMALSSLHVTADAVFPLELLLSTIIVTVVGGIGTLWGPFVGAVIITVIQESIRRAIGGVGIVGITDMVYGVLLIGIIIFLPDGIMGMVRRLWRRGR